ncbi:MAG TPA: NfeD family protein [Gammaproteobacteria bacterium]|nr:NfeD family protein [Gammaproteobacteria bacterium]
MLWGFLIAGILLAVIEIVTVTFYLAALAVAALLTALVVWLAEPSPLAAGFVFAVSALVSLLFAHRLRHRMQPRESDALADMDRGAEVRLEEVAGTALKVRYRDSLWEAVWEGPGEPAPGARAVISAREGSRLRVRAAG